MSTPTTIVTSAEKPGPAAAVPVHAVGLREAIRQWLRGRRRTLLFPGDDGFRARRAQDW